MRARGDARRPLEVAGCPHAQPAHSPPACPLTLPHHLPPTLARYYTKEAALNAQDQLNMRELPDYPGYKVGACLLVKVWSSCWCGRTTAQALLHLPLLAHRPALSCTRLHAPAPPLPRPAAQVRIQPSQAKNKLFLGGIPHELTREDLFDLLSPLVKGEPCRAASSSSHQASSHQASRAVHALRPLGLCPLSRRCTKPCPARASCPPCAGPMPHHPRVPTPASSSCLPPAPLALPTCRTRSGLDKIDMVKSKDPAHPEQNRGFCFLEFYNAACASAAKHTLSQPDFK